MSLQGSSKPFGFINLSKSAETRDCNGNAHAWSVTEQSGEPMRFQICTHTLIQDILWFARSRIKSA